MLFSNQYIISALGKIAKHAKCAQQYNGHHFQMKHFLPVKSKKNRRSTSAFFFCHNLIFHLLGEKKCMVGHCKLYYILTVHYLPHHETKLWERDPRIVVVRGGQRGWIVRSKLSTNTRGGGWVETRPFVSADGAVTE